MKRTLLYIGIALATLAGITSCSSDDELAGSSPVAAENAVIIKASVGKNSIFTRTNPGSDDPDQQTKFNPGDKISVSDGTTSVVYTLATDGTTWEPESGKYLTWHSNPTTFKAYYPTQVSGQPNSYDEGTILPIQNYKEDLETSDFMRVTKVADKESTDHTINLEFERQTARVVVNIVGYKNQWGNNPPQLNLVVVWGKFQTNQVLTARIHTYTVEEDKKYIALVCPSGSRPNEKFLEFILNDGTYLTVTGIPELQAGKSYTYNVTLGKDQATIESVTVEDWQTGSIIPDDNEAKEVKSKALAEVTEADLGKVITSDGRVYDSKNLAKADGKTPVAMIAYVGQETGNDSYQHGLAIGLDREKNPYGREALDWNEAMEYVNTYSLSAPENSSGWHVGSVNEWKRMIAACGGTPYDETLPTHEQEIDYGTLTEKMSSCGIEFVKCWTSTKDPNDETREFYLSNDPFGGWGVCWRIAKGASKCYPLLAF